MFTDKSLKGLKSKETKYTLTESTGERGESRLQVNIYPTGVIKFQIQYFIDSKRKRMEFGKFGEGLGDYTLRLARIKFGELAGLVKKDIDPRYPDRKQTRKGMASISQLYFAFLGWYENNRKENSYNTVYGFLNTNVEKGFDLTLPANQFTPDHARELIYKVWNRGSKEAAMGLKSALSMMFKYGIDYDNGPERFGKPAVFGIESNPIRDVTLSYSKTPGQRWLTDDEIRTLWHAPDMHPTFKRFLRLQLSLAGQRVEEISHSHKSEYDLKHNLFTIPVERVKIRERGAHVVPLGSLAIETFEECLKYRSKEGLLFPSTRNPLEPLPMNSIRNPLNAWLKNNPKFERFTPRDIRRTCKSHMSKAGVQRDHRDMLQQHYKNDVATVHYDRYDYLNEKREAIYMWDKYLLELIK